MPVAFRWRLDGPRPLPLTAALPLMRAVRAALMRTGNRFGIEALPDSFHHGGDGRDSAYYLPEDLDGDGLIDHAVCVSDPELPAKLLPMMAAGGTVRIGRASPLTLRPVYLGVRPTGSLFGPARRWQAVTPFVTPLEVWRRPGEGASGIRKGRGVPDQILRLIEARGLPRPRDIVTDSLGEDGARECATARRFLTGAPGSNPNGAAMAFPALIFARPVWGPIAIGAQCHFGLGLFVPIE